MLSKNVEIVDIDPNQYARVARLLSPEQGVRGPGLILFYSGSRLFHAVHTRKGTDVSVAFHGPLHLHSLAAQEGVEWVVCLERNAVKRLAAAAQSGVKFADPFSEQGRAVLRALGGELGAGIHVWPDPGPMLARMQAGMPPVLRRLIPMDIRIVVGVFDDEGGLWASLILELKNGEAVFISTSDMLEPLGLAGKSEAERAAIMLTRLAEQRGPAQMGLFCDRRTFMHLARHPRPAAALARFVRLGWVALGPCPWRIRLALRFLPLLLRK